MAHLLFGDRADRADRAAQKCSQGAGFYANTISMTVNLTSRIQLRKGEPTTHQEPSKMGKPIDPGIW